MRRLEEYQIYHNAVVEACVELMGEDNREFYRDECTYFHEYAQSIPPVTVAREQLQAIRDIADEMNQRNPKPDKESGQETKLKPAQVRAKQRYRVI